MTRKDKFAPIKRIPPPRKKRAARAKPPAFTPMPAGCTCPFPPDAPRTSDGYLILDRDCPRHGQVNPNMRKVWSDTANVVRTAAISPRSHLRTDLHAAPSEESQRDSHIRKAGELDGVPIRDWTGPEVAHYVAWVLEGCAHLSGGLGALRPAQLVALADRLRATVGGCPRR